MPEGSVSVTVNYYGPYGGDRDTITITVDREFVGPSHIPEVAQEAVKRAMAAASAS